MKFHSNMFGWDYIWRNFADSKGGEVITTTNDQIALMHIPVAGTDAHITIAPHSLKGKQHGQGTSAILHYSPSEHFVFAIRIEKGLDQIGKAVGLQDIQLGDQDFDHRFLIQGTDEAKVQNLFADMKLRDLILENGIAEMRLLTNAADLPAEHRVPSGKHAVVCCHNHTIDKFEQLEALFDIMTLVVHRLSSMPAIAGADEEQVEAPVEEKESNRLHSPLLDMA